MNQTTILIRVPLDPALYPPEDVAELDDAGLIDLFREGGYDDIYGERSTWTVERDAQGATVPRGAVAAVLADLQNAIRHPPATDRVASVVKVVRDVVERLEDLLEPAAPTTQTEKG